MALTKVNLAEKFSMINELWSPKIAGTLNGQLVKLVKFKDEFIMHQHEQEDELFLVVKGSFEMVLEHETIPVEEGEFIIIPKGTMHKPVAREEVLVMLFEPETTLNTGDKISSFTKNELDTI